MNTTSVVPESFLLDFITLIFNFFTNLLHLLFVKAVLPQPFGSVGNILLFMIFIGILRWFIMEVFGTKFSSGQDNVSQKKIGVKK